MRSHHEDLWAKVDGLEKPYPLLAHLLDTATVTQALIKLWLRPGLRQLIAEEFGQKHLQIAAWVTGIHDLGKANPVFQGQPKDNRPHWVPIRNKILESGLYQFPDEKDLIKATNFDYLRRHEQQTALFFADSWDKSIINQPIEKGWKFLPSLGHHGYFDVQQPKPGPDKSNRRKFELLYSKSGWSKAQSDLNYLLMDSLGISEDDLPEKVSPTVIILLSGLTILADRLASQLEWVKENAKLLSDGNLSFSRRSEWLTDSSARAEKLIRENLGIYQNGGPDWSSEILQSRVPHTAQKLLMEAPDGLTILMAPTGNGKTEAALLRHSMHDERLMFLLPTQATTNAMMRRVQSAFKDTTNVASLAHGLASVEDFYELPVTQFNDTECGQDSGGLFPTDFVRKGWSRLLASVSVSTVDQVLKASLPMKWSHLALLSLANSHIVIDEAHTLDHYQSELLSNILPWLGATDTRITMLTATLPSWQAKKFYAAYEQKSLDIELTFPSVITKESKIDFSTPTYHIDTTIAEVDSRNIAQEHINWALQTRNKWPLARIGIICNQIDRAQEVARQLSKQGESIVLLHSAMTAEHRRQAADLLEEQLGPNGKSHGITVIGTQAIEASLDIDLDILSTDLCPSTSLIQRAGRVWRRFDPQREQRIPSIKNLTIKLVCPTTYTTGAHYPYAPAELKRTQSWLKENSTITMPTDAQRFVEASSVTLADLGEGSDFFDDDLEQFAKQSIKKNAATNRHNSVHDLIISPRSLSQIKNLTGTREESLTRSKDDQATRYIETTTLQVILGDPTGKIPGSWPHGLSDLCTIQPKDAKAIRSALKGSIPLSAVRLGEELIKTAQYIDSPTILSQYLFVEAQSHYDPVLGFIPNNEEKGN